MLLRYNTFKQCNIHIFTNSESPKSTMSKIHRKCVCKGQGRTWKAVCEFVDGGSNVPLLQTATSQLVHRRQ